MKAPSFSRTRPNRSGIWSPPRAGTYAPGCATPAPFSNAKSILLDGSDDHVDAGTGLGDSLGDNYAGSLTVSMWFKADVTSGNDGLFDMSAFTGSSGEFLINLESSTLKFRLNAQGWTRSVSFTDTASWHHLACVYATGSEANSKMYLDGVAVGSTSGTFPSAADMDFAGLKTIIGAYYSSSYPFDGRIDEVAIFTSPLSSGDIGDLFNSGTPIDPSCLSPVSWWRLGDSNDSSDGFIYDEVDKTLGSELITGFTNGTSYPLDTLITSGRDITSAIETSGNWGGCASNAISIVAGEVYEVTFDLTYNSGTDTLNVLLTYGLDGKSGGRSTYLRTNTDGTNTAQLSVTVTDATAYLTFQTWHETDVINFAATNVSLKKVGGGGNVGILKNGAAHSTDVP